MKEKWKEIKNFENLYLISSLGRVKSVNNKDRILKPTALSIGYLKVNLYKDKKPYQKYVHRLVAETFLKKKSDYNEVNHINQNKNDNRVQNLEWCTRSYNVNYGDRNKRCSKKNSKPVLQLKNNKVIKKWDSALQAKSFGYNNTSISLCCNGKLKTHRGFKWIFQKEGEV